MPILRIFLDIDTYNRLADLAVQERRAIPSQAEILLLQMLERSPPPRLSTPTPDVRSDRR